MKTLLTMFPSTVCTFKDDIINGERRPPYVICALVSLSVVIAAMWAIGKLNKKT